MIQLRLDLFLIKCPHKAEISTEHWWCKECKTWIDGVEVGGIQVDWEDDGTITVTGGGYAPHTEAK